MGLATNLEDRVREIRVVVSDVDGTLTDGGMYYFGEDGEGKKFNVRDGAGVALLRQAGIKTVFVSGESHPTVARRARKLEVDACFVGVRSKPQITAAWLEENGVHWREVACLIDEINDIPLSRACGVSFAVADASILVQREVDCVLKTQGGDGALRELAILILTAQGTLDMALEQYLEGAAAEKEREGTL